MKHQLINCGLTALAVAAALGLTSCAAPKSAGGSKEPNSSSAGGPASSPEKTTPTQAAAPGTSKVADQGGEPSQEGLAKAAQNPIANMVSVPFQNNFNFGIGPNNATRWNLNVQPVIPISLNEDWNLITRTIIPVINQPSPAPGVPSAFGLGDINPQFYLSPAKPGALIWGVGPTFTFPTATDPLLGSSKWSAGPDLVVLSTPGHWVVGRWPTSNGLSPAGVTTP